MCVNREVSLAAYVVATAACMRLWCRNHPNDRWIAATLGYIATMQLLEFLMHHDQSCGPLNQTATKVAFWQNLLQPAVFIVAALVFSGGRLPWYAWASTLAYLAYVVPAMLEARAALGPNPCTTTCPGDDSGLRFPYTTTSHHHPLVVWTLFALAMALPFGAMERDGGLYVAAILVTYTIALVVGRVRQCGVNPATGSWWCLFGLAIPLLALYRNGGPVRSLA